jgi:hypothetical protein
VVLDADAEDVPLAVTGSIGSGEQAQSPRLAARAIVVARWDVRGRVMSPVEQTKLKPKYFAKYTPLGEL